MQIVLGHRSWVATPRRRTVERRCGPDHATQRLRPRARASMSKTRNPSGRFRCLKRQNQAFRCFNLINAVSHSATETPFNTAFDNYGTGGLALRRGAMCDTASMDRVRPVLLGMVSSSDSVPISTSASEGSAQYLPPTYY